MTIEDLFENESAFAKIISYYLDDSYKIYLDRFLIRISLNGCHTLNKSIFRKKFHDFIESLRLVLKDNHFLFTNSYKSRNFCSAFADRSYCFVSATNLAIGFKRASLYTAAAAFDLALSYASYFSKIFG